MKKGFSLLELIFAIVVIAIISAFAVPKYMNTRDSALASTIKRDIVTATTSIQSHYLINRKLEKISDAVNLNTKNWIITDKKITFKDGESVCVDLEVNKKQVNIILKDNAGSVCDALKDLGIYTQSIELI